MKIVIDTIPLLSHLTGIGQYTAQLVKHFKLLSPWNDYTYYYGYFRNELLQGNGRKLSLGDALSRFPAVKYAGRRVNDVLSYLHSGKFDLYFEPNFIPLNVRAKYRVTTVHDLSVQLYPETHPADRVDYFSRHFRTKVLRSDRIITDSEYVKAEAKSFLGLPDDRLTVIHLGVDHDLFHLYNPEALEFWRKKFSLPEKFILFVGTKERRKNLDALRAAYAALPAAMRREFKLVCVGQADPNREARAPLPKEIEESITDLGYIEAPALASVFNLASLFVFPSLYEGFGLPPLEAMACGCPVVVSKVASLPEVCGDAAYYVDPKDVDSIAQGMSVVLNDETLRRSLIVRGLERAKLFTWEKTARATLNVFEQVLGIDNQ